MYGEFLCDLGYILFYWNKMVQNPKNWEKTCKETHNVVSTYVRDAAQRDHKATGNKHKKDHKGMHSPY